MKNPAGTLRGALGLTLFIFFAARVSAAPGPDHARRGDTLENFESGTVILTPYPGEDMEPGAWALDSNITHNASSWSLRLDGNTWKVEAIAAVPVDSGAVWQVWAYVPERAELQGIGLMDSQHVLFYAFMGSAMADTLDWITVYQGAFPLNTWNEYLLPVADDWLARFGYLPRIEDVVYVNDRDSTAAGRIYFDDIIDVSRDQPVAPRVRAWHESGGLYRDRAGRCLIDVQFYSEVIDPDGGGHRYRWSFGDESTSTQPQPSHTYVVTDDHEYSVLLEVVDSTDRWGRARDTVRIDQGPSTFPLTVNFVGDIMMARRYEDPGGIIPTLGVEAIFEPTRPWLGLAADITAANLECSLTDQGTPHPTKPIIFRSSPRNVAGLVYAGIDVVSLANNHIIDYGLEGLRETQFVLKGHQIRSSGAGADANEAGQPLFVVKNGVSIAYLAECNRTGQYDNYQPYLDAGFNKPGFANLTSYTIARHIEAVRDQADVVIYEMHSGEEYIPQPSGIAKLDGIAGDEMYSPVLVPSRTDLGLRRQAIDEGADLVVCHHAHLLQGFEVRNQRLIAHSLGDFVFDLNYPETYPSAILSGRIDARGLYDYTVTPVYIDDYIPVRARGGLGVHILDYLGRRSREFSTVIAVSRDSVDARIILDTAGWTPTATPISVVSILEARNGFQVSPPVKVRGRGHIGELTSIEPPRAWEYRLGRDLIWCGNFEDEGSTLWDLNQLDEFYDSIAYAGERSLCQRRSFGAGAITTNLEERIPCYSDSIPYSLAVHIKTQNAADAGMSIRFYRYRTGSSLLGTADLDTLVDGTTDWHYYWNDFTPADLTCFFDIMMSSTGTSVDSAGRAWFDEAALIEWEPWQTFNGSVPVAVPNDFYWLQVRTNSSLDSALISYDETTYDSIPQGKLESSSSHATGLIVYPNPGRGRFTIRFTAPGTWLRLAAYNTLGQRVRTLADGAWPPGIQHLFWDGRDDRGRTLGAGVYFVRLETPPQETVQKIIVSR